ncbi:MAG: chromate transporter [Clostridia bacterium]
MTYLLLFWEFFKAGLFAIGGGLATLPFILKMMDHYPSWFGTLSLADIVAIAESTPGPIGVNAATFAGYSAGGIGGGILASFAVVLPSFITVTLIAGALKKYRENKFVNDAFDGLRPAVTGLIAAAGYSVLKIALIRGDLANGFFQAIDWRCLILLAVLFTATQIKKLSNLHPIVYIFLGAAAGLLLSL